MTEFSTEQWHDVVQNKYYDIEDQRIEVMHIWAKDSPTYYVLLCADSQDLKRKSLLEFEFPIESRHLVNYKRVENFEKAVNLLLFLIPIGLIVLCAFLLSKRFKRSFAQLTQGISQIKDGQFNVTLSGKNYKELDAVFDDFNSLAQQLHQSELEKKDLNQSKQKMLLDISHDLRTPSTTIQGYAKALNEGMVTSPEIQKKYLRYIYSKSKHVTDCINALFKYSRLDNDLVQMSLTRVDAFQFMRESLIPYIDTIEDNNMVLDIKIPEEPYHISLDCFEMRRVISNLLDNAIKYNPKGTCITVEAYVDQALYIRIKDDGIGIESHLESIIFDPLVRGDHARSSDGGMGIGLSIVKKVIEHHGGKIGLEAVHKGSSFIIELPIKS